MFTENTHWKSSKRLSLYVLAALCIAVPWLNPFASGPAPVVVSTLLAWGCAVILVASGLGVVPTFAGPAKHKCLGRVVAAAWLAAALVSAGVALAQYFGVAAIFGDWVSTAAQGQAYANLRQRNQFATLTNIGLASVFFFVADSESARRATNVIRRARFLRPPAWTFLSAITTMLLVSGNAASSSRTGLVQLLLLSASVWAWSSSMPLNIQKQVRRTTTFAVFFYGVASLALPLLARADPQSGMLARLREGDSICSSRVTLWSNVLHLIAQKPWFGWGWGELDYAHFITLYPNERFCDILDNAHNLPLHLAVELGLPAALTFCSGVVWWVWRNKPWADQNPTRQLAWGVLAVIALHSLLEYPLWYGPFQMAVGLCLLLLWRTRPSRQAGDLVDTTVKTRRYQIVTWITRVAAVLCLVVLAAAAWDYWRVSQLYKIPKQREPQYQVNTLEKVRDSWFFQDQVQFAELMTVPLDRENAAHRYAQAQRLLHFSPEPRVIEAVIESAAMLGKNDEAVYYAARYKAAFAPAYAAWVAKSARDKAS